jgi:hypothetical protein
MRIKSLRMASILAFFALIALSPQAKAINPKAGTTAYTFLRIGSGAKSQGMGGAFVGLSDDATALFYNPAGLTATGSSEQTFDELLGKQIFETPINRFTASYVNYLLDFQYGFVGYARRFNPTTEGGISVTYQNYGTFKQLDGNGIQTGTFGASDVAIGFTYSKQLRPRFSAGVTGKLILEKIDTYSSSGLGADAGLMYLLNDEGTTRLGLAVTNVGAQLKGFTANHKDPLPSKIAVGLSHKMVGLPFLFSGEVGKPFDNDFYLALGAQLVSLKPFFIRAGWTTAGKDYHVGTGTNLGGFSGGFGYNYKLYELDYSYSSYADLGGVHRVTLGAGF